MVSVDQGLCAECGQSFPTEAEHVDYVMQDIQRIIADAARRRWERVRDQVVQRRMEI